MGSAQMQRALIVLGLVLLAIGVAWPWMSRLGLGRLPGDIRIERDGFGFYFPITTGIVVSLVLTFLIWLMRK
jgi:formate hydrogenlyase subunit 3/multisubunit Na+/H+ antiporter MnhD subunit